MNQWQAGFEEHPVREALRQLRKVLEEVEPQPEHA